MRDENGLLIATAVICLLAWAAWRWAVNSVAGTFGADPGITGTAMANVFWLMVGAGGLQWMLYKFIGGALSLILVWIPFIMGAWAFWRPVIHSAASAYSATYPYALIDPQDPYATPSPWWDTWWSFWSVEAILAGLLVYLLVRQGRERPMFWRAY